MIWINKRNKHYRKKAHRIINHFIHNAWSVSDQRYIGLTFDDLKKVKKFKSLLFNEQHGYCCYCMRKLDLSKSHLSTIEHILPHKIKITDYNDIAFYYSYIPFFHKYVKVLSPKSIKGKLKNGRPYPHFCAYENLVLSCSGAIFKSNFPENEYPSKLHECCNNRRGNKLILPFFYLKQPMLCYEKDGCITYDDNNI